MRKNELRRCANNQLNNDKQGAYPIRQYRHFVIHKVIDDLFKLKQCPPTWYGLTKAHLLALVSHWNKQKIKPATVMKYMTVIRYFLQHINHPIDGIDNQTLGILRIPSSVKKAKPPAIILKKPTHPIAQMIIDLQSEFGLTFSEAIRLTPDLHFQEHSLWLTREITFNRHDRVIPIRTNEQRLLLQKLKEMGQSLLASQGYHALRHIYRTTGLSPTKSLRPLYAKHQLAFLSQDLSKKEASLLIMREMV